MGVDHVERDDTGHRGGSGRLSGDPRSGSYTDRRGRVAQRCYGRRGRRVGRAGCLTLNFQQQRFPIKSPSRTLALSALRIALCEGVIRSAAKPDRQTRLISSRTSSGRRILNSTDRSKMTHGGRQVAWSCSRNR